MSYRGLVEYLVGSVIERPDLMEIEEEFRAGTRTFTVTVGQEDVGKLIGKGGRVISAIRHVVSSVAQRQKEKAYVKVPTPE